MISASNFQGPEIPKLNQISSRTMFVFITSIQGSYARLVLGDGLLWVVSAG